MTTQRHICLDIDGTLFEMGARIDFEDPASILRHSRPIPSAVRRLNQLLDLGVKVSFVTGRHEKVAGATHCQLRDAFGERATRGVDVVHRDFQPWDMMMCVLYKFDALRLLNPDLYVGDLMMDQTAAAAAGVPFMPAEWFAGGQSFDHLLFEEYRPAAIRDAADALGFTAGLPVVA